MVILATYFPSDIIIVFIQDGKSRRRAAIFYTVIATENAACVAIYLQLSKEQDIRPWFHTLAPILVLAGFILGDIV